MSLLDENTTNILQSHSHSYAPSGLNQLDIYIIIKPRHGRQMGSVIRLRWVSPETNRSKCIIHQILIKFGLLIM